MKNKQRSTKNSSVMEELRAIRRRHNEELVNDPEGFFKRLAEFRKMLTEEYGIEFVGVDE